MVVRSVSDDTSTDGGSDAVSCGSSRLDAVDDGDDVRARLALDVQDDGRRLVHPRCLPDVLYVVDDAGHIGESDRRRRCGRRRSRDRYSALLVS